MSAGKLRLIVTTSFAESLDGHPLWLNKCQAPWWHDFFFLSIHIHDFFAQVWHFSVAGHAGWILFLDICVGLLSLSQKIANSLAPYFLVVNRCKWFQHPSELFFFFCQQNRRSLRFAAIGLLWFLRFKLQLGFWRGRFLRRWFGFRCKGKNN